MEFNLILAGVGGQGILTTAKAISIAAVRRGLTIKQAEVHGMSQRGGAVQSHLRIADHELHSDVIPRGRVDMILAVEPMEALRYIQDLSEGGVIVSSTAPLINIQNYGPVERVLEEISKYPRHILLDANSLAKAAGSVRSVNMAILGAASIYIDIGVDDFNAAINEMFAMKKKSLVELNQKAFALGRSAAEAYRDGLLRGASSRTVRLWLGSVSPEQMADVQFPDPDELSGSDHDCGLSQAEIKAISQTLTHAEKDNRKQLYEHEVYGLIELIGAISPPTHVFVPNGMKVKADTLSRFASNKVVLKIVSPDIVHKTDAGAVVFVPNDPIIVAREIDRMISRQSKGGSKIAGVLIVEFVEQGQSGFGKELFVGIRSTREFGPVIAAGLGGVNTEYLASKLKPGIAVAKALAAEISAEEFFDLFKETAAYDILSGQARGHERIISDGELMRCFRAFIAIARGFCIDRGTEGPDLKELEVNPFAFRRQMMVPLDGRGRLGPATPRLVARPISRIKSLLQPRSIALVGASSKRENFGRIILNNITDCGFPPENVYIIKDQKEPIDGIRCFPSIAALPSQVDLLILAASAQGIPNLIDQIVESGKVAATIIIPGGLGEKEGTEEKQDHLRKVIAASRNKPDGGPIFLGGNCLGVRSRPGKYDTFFIHSDKLNPRRDATPRRAALISQSGAFIITRLSNLQTLDPMFTVSIGNQIDITVSDLLRATGERDDIDAIGIYVEGFQDMDGVAFVKAVEEVTAAGKTVIFYKAGRTEEGRSATAGHTASIAGDYDVCQSAATTAGAIVTDTFAEFEQLVELATALHGKEVSGTRLGAISNAGYETVGMADAVVGPRHHVDIPTLCDETAAKLTRVLAKHKLDALVNTRNPLDVTPMANDEAFEDCIRVLMDDDNLDAIVAAFVPMTPEMATLPDDLRKPGSIAQRLPQLFKESKKPLVVVIDSGPPFEQLALAIREAGVPVFRSSDRAIRSLGRYLCHRTEQSSNGG